MPFVILKNQGTKTFRVVNSQTGKVHALKHAQAQLRLLNKIIV